MREGYRGAGHEDGSGQISGSITADLNTHDHDPAGQKSQDPPKSVPEAMAAAEDLAADTMNLFMDVIQDPEKMKALERDQNTCVKCGKTADEVDHIREIWEGGPEFDLDNLQSLCHDCHVAKTNESRKKRGTVAPEASEKGP